MKKHSGLSSLSLLAILIGVAFIGTFLFRAVPAYVSYFTLKSVISSVDSPRGTIDDRTPAEIREMLRRAFAPNSIDVDVREVLVNKAGSGTTLSYDYEHRVPFVYNIELLISFDVSYNSADGE